MNPEPLGWLTFGVPTKPYESLDYRCCFFTEIPRTAPVPEQPPSGTLSVLASHALYSTLLPEPFLPDKRVPLAISGYRISVPNKYTPC
jgi:hypothetical protein